MHADYGLEPVGAPHRLNYLLRCERGAPRPAVVADDHTNFGHACVAIFQDPAAVTTLPTPLLRSSTQLRGDDNRGYGAIAP